MRSIVLGLVAALCASAAVACSNTEPSDHAARSEPTAPAVTPCGHLKNFPLGVRTPVEKSEPAACMRKALADHHAAVVRITQPTVEGDPIHETYRLGANGRVSLTIDSREDSFAGSGAGIHHVACTKPTWLPGATCPPPPPKPYADATWTLDRKHSTIGSSTTGFVALVTRAECNSGRTGRVTAPMINVGAHSIEVTFRLPRDPRATARIRTCQANHQVAYRVHLPVQLRGRLVTDGGCHVPSVGRSLACHGSRVRIHPPGWREAMGGQEPAS